MLVIGAAGGIHAVTGGGTGLMTAPVGIEKAASGQKSDEGSEGSSELKDGATAGVEKNAQKKMPDLCIQSQKLMRGRMMQFSLRRVVEEEGRTDGISGWRREDSSNYW